MPYGVESKEYEGSFGGAGEVKVQCLHTNSVGQTTILIDRSRYGELASQYWRTGSNTNEFRSKAKSKKPVKQPYAYVVRQKRTELAEPIRRLVWKKLPGGERRQVVKLTRYIYTPYLKPLYRKSSRRPPLTKGESGLTPNQLFFESWKQTVHGTDLQATGLDYLGNPATRNWVGDVWSSLVYTGWAPPPQQFYELNWRSIGTSYDTQVSALSERCLNSLHEKVRNENVNLAQAFAEMGKTAQSIGDIAARLAKVIMDMRRGKLERAVSTLFGKGHKDHANDVLLYQYGILPLLSDIDGAAKELAEYAEKSHYDIVSTKNESVSEVVEMYDPSYACTRRLFVEAEISVKYKARVTITNTVGNLASRLGFTNPAALVWELVPFSFVVDWFLSIGDWLKSLDPCTGHQVEWVTRTVFIKRRVKMIATYDGLASDGWTWAGSAGWDTESIYCRRFIETNSGLPALPLPKLKNPFSNNHMAIALSLILQRK